MKEVVDSGVIVHPINSPNKGLIRVASTRVRPCPVQVLDQEFWPKRNTPKKTPEATPHQVKRNVWTDCLRSREDARMLRAGICSAACII